MKLQVVTDENRHERTLRALFRNSTTVTIVENQADYVINIHGIDHLSLSGIRELINNAGKTPIIGELGYISDRGEIVGYDLPKPQPEYFSTNLPASYIILSRKRVPRSSSSIFQDPTTRKLHAIVGLTKELKWIKSNEQECLDITKTSVDIIIPTALSKRGDKPYIYDLLDSLKIVENASIKNVIVIVDDLTNNSFDYPGNTKLKVIDFTEEFNFSKKINLGLKFSNSEIVIFMNDDLICKSEFWLEHSIHSLMGTSVGAVGALLQYPNEKIQHAGIQIINRELSHLFLNHEVTNRSFEKLPKVYEVSAITGAFMALKKSSLKLVQNMDEDFPINFGDIDLCFKLRENNLRCVQNNLVVFTHFESATRKKGVTAKELSLLYFKWAHMFDSDSFFPRNTSRIHYSKFRILLNSFQDRGFLNTLGLIFKKVILYFKN